MSTASNPPVSDTAAETPASSPPAEEELDDYEPLTPEFVEEEAIRGDFVLKWAVVLLAFLLGSTRIGESQTLVHLKTGEYLRSHGWLPPANDVFSYTAADRPWTNLSWGFDLVSGLAHAAASFAGLSLLKALIAALIFGLVVHTSRPNLPTWWGSICAVLALLACHLRLTIQPTLVTFLGTAFVLWLIHAWREEGPKRPSLWLLVPAFLAWGNLDSRAFLGLGLLLLFALGETAAGALKSPAALVSERRRQLWLVFGASVVAMLVHPFGYKALLAPWYIYGVDYPAYREYVQGTYLGITSAPIWPGLVFFPMTTETFWSHLDLAALTMLALPPVLFLLNRKRLDLAHLLVYAGCLLVAITSLHELPWGALVCGVIATLEGQKWYAAACRQTYSIDTSELVFSRGGRVLTVLVFAAIAFFGGTGRLREPRYPRTGYGLDQTLGTTIEELEGQLAGEKSFDHRPFNQYLTQGDVLIWVGEQVFADNRVGIYFSRESAKNLLLDHAQTREALRPPRERQSGSGGGSATAGLGRRRVWKKTFDDHQVTHAVLRISPDSLSGIDYDGLLGLLHDEFNWQLTSLGAAAAVFYRRDLDKPDLEAYVTENAVDFNKLAFRESRELPLPRDMHVRPPSFYQRYFWSSKRELTAEVQQALHLVRLGSLPLPRRYEADRGALALLAVRLAQAGLSKDPDSSVGYLVLGQAYQLLADREAVHALNGSRSPYSGTRYLQSVTSYNQALVADPDNRTAHYALASMYQQAQRPELALRHLEALEQLMAKDRNVKREELNAISDGGAQLRGNLAAFDGELAQAPPGDAGMQQRVSQSLARGCIVRALKELDDQVAMMTGNLVTERLRIMLLLEAGRVDEAYDSAQRFAEAASRNRLPEWPHVVALADLTEGNYKMAFELWGEEANQIEEEGIRNTLTSLPLRQSTPPWPIGPLQHSNEMLYSMPENIASREMEIALVALEAGQLELAEESLRRTLELEPESRHRPLAAYYLYQLTGKEEVDLLPPSERIPVLFAPEPGTETEPAAP